MELRNLITFIHVAELGSFTKTAETLGYSQSTVSFQIKQLEDELGSVSWFSILMKHKKAPCTVIWY